VAIEICMPKWGLTMKEGKITRWLKKVGDPVEQDEPLFEVETDKITNEVESIASGILSRIIVDEGETVPIGTVVGILAEPGESVAQVEGPAADADAKALPAKQITGEFVPATPAARRLARELDVVLAKVTGSGPDSRVLEDDVKKHHEQAPPEPKATPLAKEIAKQAGLDLSTVRGTGEGGKITKEDVLRALEPEAPEAEPEVAAESAKSIPFKGMRKVIADNLHASLQNTAQLTTFMEVDVTEAVEFREVILEEFRRKDDSVKVSFNDIIILAVSRALKRHPIMNARLEGDEIILHDAVHMGIAVALPEGLIVPKIRNADKKGLLEIAGAAREIADKARNGALGIDEISGGTFTISNLGMFGQDGFTPILNPPETGIIGVGRVKEKPAVHEGEIKIRSMMTLSLTWDHRVADGAPAAAFLQTVGKYLEEPRLMMA
jgi:pyruvate dehydrogenase E2 component (dihydrolipoamide acetyltransferase)